MENLNIDIILKYLIDLKDDGTFILNQEIL